MRAWTSGLTLAAIALVASVGIASAQEAERPPAKRTPHPTAGNEDCLRCHAPGANEHVSDTPAGHPTGTRGCLMCHRVVDSLPSTTPHALTGDRVDCVSCHARGATGDAPKQSESHRPYNVAVCGVCHVARTPS